MLLKELTQLIEAKSEKEVAKLADDYTNEVYLQEPNMTEDQVVKSIKAFLRGKVPSNQIEKITNQIFLQLE